MAKLKDLVLKREDLETNRKELKIMQQILIKNLGDVSNQIELIDAVISNINKQIDETTTDQQAPKPRKVLLEQDE